MAQQIKFNIFTLLFRMFSFLTDKTNGYSLFAKPKILLGSLIIGVSSTACSPKQIKPTTTQNTDSLTITNKDTVEAITKVGGIEPIINCYTEPVIVPPESIDMPMCYKPVVNCYEVVPDTTHMPNETVNPPTQDAIYEVAEIMPPTQDAIYEVAEIMPQFPGGEEAMLKFIGKELAYPASAVKMGLQGRVRVSFVVGKDGSLSSIAIEKSVDDTMDEEALRIVRRMPKWIAGKQNGQPIKVRMIIPIMFRLPNK